MLRLSLTDIAFARSTTHGHSAGSLGRPLWGCPERRKRAGTSTRQRRAHPARRGRADRSGDHGARAAQRWPSLHLAQGADRGRPAARPSGVRTHPDPLRLHPPAIRWPACARHRAPGRAGHPFHLRLGLHRRGARHRCPEERGVRLRPQEQPQTARAGGLTRTRQRRECAVRHRGRRVSHSSQPVGGGSSALARRPLLGSQDHGGPPPRGGLETAVRVALPASRERPHAPHRRRRGAAALARSTRRAVAASAFPAVARVSRPALRARGLDPRAGGKDCRHWGLLGCLPCAWQ